MRYLAIFLGSFVLVFTGTYFYVTKVEYPRKYGSSLNPSDSSKVSEDVPREATLNPQDSSNVSILKEDTIKAAWTQPASTSPNDTMAHRARVHEEVGPKVSYFKLAKLYSAMRPQEAASALSKLDDELVVQILSKMEERKAAKILAAIGSDRAAELTVRMLAIKTRGMW